MIPVIKEACMPFMAIAKTIEIGIDANAVYFPIFLALRIKIPDKIMIALEKNINPKDNPMGVPVAFKVSLTSGINKVIGILVSATE